MSSEPSGGAPPSRAPALERFSSEAPGQARPQTPSQASKVLHALEVHQIELETQNEALLNAHAKVQEALLFYTGLYDFAPCGLLTLGRTGEITRGNVMAGTMLGGQPADMLGKRLASFVRQEDVAAVHKLVNRVFMGMCNQVIEVALRHGGQEPRIVQLQATLSPDGEGCCVGMADIAARHRPQAARSEAADLPLDHQVEEAMSQARSTFISCMSHELRTPLNAILGFTQLLQMDRQHVLDDLQYRRVQAILVAGRLLLQLVEDVLDMARIKSGAVHLERRPVHIRELIDDALTSVAPSLDGSGLSIAVDCLPDASARDAVIHGDKARLVQVLVNLLTNAIKYGSPGGTVRMVVDTTSPALTCIAIEDTGPGMSSDELARAFEPFNRLGQELGDIPGIGVGLVIAKWLVEMMGGALKARSEPGKGSRFDVFLPRHPFSTPRPGGL